MAHVFLLEKQNVRHMMQCIMYERATRNELLCAPNFIKYYDHYWLMIIGEQISRNIQYWINDMNTAKCCYIHFKARAREVIRPSSWTNYINNFLIKNVSSAKLLGVIIENQNLSREDHIKSLSELYIIPYPNLLCWIRCSLPEFVHQQIIIPCSNPNPISLSVYLYGVGPRGKVKFLTKCV